MTVVDPMRYRYICRSITLDPDGSVALEYTEPALDIRANGLVVNKVIFVPGGSDYDDEIEALYEAVQALLRDVEDDLTTVPPHAPRQRQLPDDDDDDSNY